MTNCPGCASELPETSRFCSSCGTALDSAEFKETRAFTGRPAAATRDVAARYGAPQSPSAAVGVDSPGSHATGATFRPAPGSRLSSSDSIHEGRFIPGTMLAGRYRIVGQLGKGGMGEVYRADDLKLGQQVALKFLPEMLASDPGRLDRFLNEVRVARQISHPNVCRVYDIGEVDGIHYISMEYVDGEDLSSLLRRIGRLSSDKAIEIARQLCAGLAAAHEKGVLHRDLKPANVMLDGRGKVRITDFGLAALAGEVRGAEVRVGTPAYMAPEQLAGKEVTLRSDIYSLGLVIYESLTGKTVFSADTLADLMRAHTETMPVAPSSVITDIDPALERVILRCLEKDPAARPASVLAVAAALPGGDPLAAALAAGETPSPEMVAAAGEEGALKPLVALGCMALVVVGFAARALLAPSTTLVGMAPPAKQPAVLAERARSIIATLGYTGGSADDASGIVTDQDFLEWVRKNDLSLGRWNGLAGQQPPAILYWYREAPRQMEPLNQRGAVTYFDPPMTGSGMRSVVLDTQGRLVEFTSVPPQVEESPPPPGEPQGDPDWSALFKEAGLDPSVFTPVESKWNPISYADTKAAWEGPVPDRPDARLRVEAASYRGKPVYFETLGPWSRPTRMQPFEQRPGLQVALVINILLILGVMVSGIVLARRNIRLGRGDRRGAFRVALFMLAASMIVRLLEASHGQKFANEFNIFVLSLGVSLFLSGLVWVLYVALEPIVRRRSPDSIVSWSRLLAGRLRDPLVGRDILVGAVFGVLSSIVAQLRYLAPTWIGAPPPIPDNEAMATLLGTRYIVSFLFNTQLGSIISAMFLLFFLTLGRVWSRGANRMPVIIFFLIATIMTTLFAGTRNPATDLPICATLALILTFVFVRFGLLAAMASQFVASFDVPLTFDTSSWYFPGSMLAVILWLSLIAYGFYVSLGGRPLFAGRLIED